MESEGRERVSVENRSLPPDVQEWIAKTAAQLRRALDNPQVRAEITSLLCGDEARRIRSDDASDEANWPAD